MIRLEKMIKQSRVYTAITVLDNAIMTFFGLIYPLYALSIGLTNFQMTLLNAVFFHLAVLLLEVPTGVVADVFGKKTSVVFGMLCFAIGITIFTIPNFWAFAAGETFAALGGALISGALDAWLIEEVGEKKSKKILANTGFYANIVGISVGLVSGVIATQIGYSLVTLSSGIMLILLAVFAWLFMKSDANKIEHEHKGLEALLDTNKKSWSFFLNSDKLNFSIFAALIFFGYIPLFMFWQAIFTDNGLNLAFIGVVSAVNSLSMAFGNKLANSFKSSLNGVRIGLSLILSGIFGIALLVPINVWLGVLMMGVFEIGIGLYTPSHIHFFNTDLPNNIRASLNSIFSLIKKVGSTSGLVVGGFIADQVGREGFLIFAGIWLLAVAITFLLKVKNKPL